MISAKSLFMEIIECDGNCQGITKASTANRELFCLYFSHYMYIDSYFQLLYLSFLSCVINDLKELASGKHWSGKTKVWKPKYGNQSWETEVREWKNGSEKKKKHLLVSRVLLTQDWGFVAKEWLSPSDVRTDPGDSDCEKHDSYHGTLGYIKTNATCDEVVPRPKPRLIVSQPCGLYASDTVQVVIFAGTNFRQNSGSRI